MPIEDPVTATSEQSDQQEGASKSAWMFRGPAAYVPHTPWTPLAGSVASVGIFMGAVVAVAAVILIAWAWQHSATEVFVTIVGTLVQQVAMIGLTWIAASRYGAKPADVLALHSPAQGWKAYPIAFVLLVGLTLVMNFAVQAFDQGASKGDIALYKDMMKSEWWWLAFIIVGIGAPLSEELLCRGFLFSALANSRFGTTGAAIITSLGFAVAHPYSLIGVLQVFFIGMLFSWVLVRTGSLRVTMVCHALYNTLMATLLIANIDP